jgi:ElaB/YqjD/DUF883 family membrane-anchored ribosome-binding protein
MSPVNSEKLIHDMRAIASDVEALLRATAGSANSAIAEAHSKVEESVRLAKENLAAVSRQASRDVRAAGRAADDYIHDNPWTVISIAAGAGVLLGLLLGRRSRS